MNRHTNEQTDGRMDNGFRELDSSQIRISEIQMYFSKGQEAIYVLNFLVLFSISFLSTGQKNAVSFRINCEGHHSISCLGLGSHADPAFLPLAP